VGDAVELATHIRLSIARPLALGTGTVHLTASVGIAVAGDDATADTLLRDADSALHHAKLGGRNRHTVFEPVLRNTAVDRVEIEAALHTAIAHGELLVHYQPVIDLSSGATVGVEALVRWDRPGHGLVPPDAFVPVAEQAGIINELGAFVLRHAIHDAADWYDHLGINLAVNVSASQLTDPGLAESVLEELAAAGLPAEALSLELTETAYTSASDAAVETLQLVRRSGVRIALDDFGSGYSSLDRVRRFPVDAIKIDRESVVALPRGERDVTIVRAMIELAHALGVPVVAEGVESEAEHAVLVELGCDLAQGYLYAEPLPPEELAKRIGLRSASGHHLVRGR
jgi:EAL domain-containing protein (putative c-di-GMP-specific phosphodiesterase class I)